MRKINWYELLATDFYCGLLPHKLTKKYKGGGTLGTIIGFLLAFIFPKNDNYYIFIVSVLIIAAILISGKASKYYKAKDDQRIIIDETVGYFVTMAFLPRQFNIMVFGFIVFRFFDGIKPWPIKWLDKKIKGGFGIVLDDLIAGIFSNITIRIFMH